MVLFIYFLLLFKYGCLHFPPPLSPTSPTPNSHPQFNSFLVLSMGPLYMFLDDPFPIILIWISPLTTNSDTPLIC